LKGKRTDVERAHLQRLPERRTTDFEEIVLRVSRTGGFTLRVNQHRPLTPEPTAIKYMSLLANS
jgi:hypothetical protein